MRPEETRHIKEHPHDRMRKRGTEERSAYLMNLSKLMVEHGLVEITKKKHIKLQGSGRCGEP